MAKPNNRVRSSVVDSKEVSNPEEIDRIIGEEFNPVKTEKERSRITAKEFLEQFAEYYYSNNRSVQPLSFHIDSFLEHYEDPQVETEELPKESEINKELPYDRARLEFLRMTIGPVQNFYTTLGNILLSVGERLAKVEARLYAAELKGKMQEEYALLIASEGRFVSMEEFKSHWEKLEKEKDASKKL